MLHELQALVNRQSERSETDLKGAANALLTQQFLYYENDRQSRHYMTVTRHFEYYKHLFDALGWQLYADKDFAYVGVLPGDEETYLQLGIEATLMMFTARQIFEEGIEENKTQHGRVYIAVENLVARYETLVKRSRPLRPVLKDILALFVRHGLIARADDDESGNPTIALLPALRQVAGDRVLERVEAHIAASRAQREVGENAGETEAGEI